MARSSHGGSRFGSEENESMTWKPRTTMMMKFLCSYGGRIMPRLTDGKLCYVGGHTRVFTVDRSISFTELMVKLGEFCGSSVRIKCQLPDGDLETLISITSDEDLRHVMAEYDKANSSSSSPPHRLKIRAILLPPKSLKSISPPPSPLGYYSPPSAAVRSPISLVKEARCVAGRRPFLKTLTCNHSTTYFVPQRSK